jgi:hypothetical protein
MIVDHAVVARGMRMESAVPTWRSRFMAPLCSLTSPIAIGRSSRAVSSIRRVRVRRALWTIFTHLGGVWCSILAAAIPLALASSIAAAARQTLGTLVLSPDTSLSSARVRSSGSRTRPRGPTGYECQSWARIPKLTIAG